MLRAFCPLARSRRGVAAQRCDLWSVESFVMLGRGGLRGQRLTLRVGPVPSEKKAEERPTPPLRPPLIPAARRARRVRPIGLQPDGPRARRLPRGRQRVEGRAPPDACVCRSPPGGSTCDPGPPYRKVPTPEATKVKALSRYG